MARVARRQGLAACPLIPGCRATASGTCTALVEGYPLPWLTAQQNDPLIFKGALLKDCAQWALVSMSVLYLGWSRIARDGASTLPGRFPSGAGRDGGVVGAGR